MLAPTYLSVFSEWLVSKVMAIAMTALSDTPVTLSIYGKDKILYAISKGKSLILNQ